MQVQATAQERLLPPENGKTWLNTISVVDGLIRSFTKELMAIVERPDLKARLEMECRRMNNLFLGITPSDQYETGSWNDPEQLGFHILVVLHINGETRLAVRDAFMVFASKVLGIAENSKNGFSKEDDKKITDLIAELRSALLGLPAL